MIRSALPASTFSPALPATKAAPSAPSGEAAPADRVELSAPQEPTPGAAQLVDVGHRRELRGCWVATVWNINFPSSPTAPTEKQKEEMVALLDRLKECGFNSIFFQVRPEGDATYASQLEPWSSFVSGKQGKNPGYDPLQFLIDESHARGIEVHAWLNPYRAGAATKDQVPPHIATEHPQHVHPYGSTEWMDPGADVVRQKLVDVCKDLTARYDVDGIHFDDYFYPYPNGNDFPDQLTWNAYQASGGTLSKADWRRENVNKAVREVNQAVKETKDHVRFGISPFGLPAPDRPPGVTGFDQYEGLYADTQKWMNEGWVDYLAPQLYWPTTQPKQPYGPLLNWWADHSKGGRHIFGGNNLADLGKPKYTPEEYKAQVRITRAKYDQGATGNIWWHSAPLMENRQNIVSTFKNELYAQPALTPVLPLAQGKTVAHPQVQVEGNRVRLEHQDEAPLRAWTVYRKDQDRWKLDRILPAEQNEVELAAGQWAIAAAPRHGVESKGVVVNC